MADTILEQDIRLLQSRVMDDVPEGGGAPVGTVIVDGASNAVFDDTNDLDTANGNVSLRKVFVHVATANAAKYAGANVMVAEPPGDDLLSLTLFQTDNFFDTRSAAVSRLESYLSAGGTWNGYLYERHIAGQQIIQLIQRVDTKLPNIGAVFALVQDETYPAEIRQYVRVKRVSYEVVTFTDDSGDFVRWVVSCEITAPLATDFKGQAASRQAMNRSGAGLTVIRNTIVANAARYYGYQPLAAAVTRGARQVKAKSIYTQLVPSSEIDVPISDATANSAILAPVRTANGSLTTYIPALNATTVGYLGGSVMPGSVKGTSATNANLVDRGDGSLYQNDTQVGSIDYQNGLITVASGSYGGNFSFTPAAFPSVASESASVAFSAESRPGSIALTLNPVPAPGTLVYTYFAQGNRYVLRDNGSGAIVGDDPAYGAGKLSYITGGVTITMGALPDAPSLGVLNWACPQNILQGFIGTVRGKYRLKVGAALTPKAATLTWTLGTTDYTCTINAQGGFSGDATGSINWATGEIEFSPIQPLAATTQINIGYTEASSSTSALTLALLDQGASLEATLDGGCAPGTFRGQITVTALDSDIEFAGKTAVRTIEDDGNGNIRAITIDAGGATSAVNVGTINYTAGVIRLNKTITFSGAVFSATSVFTNTLLGALSTK